jgi:hypothetical protein
VPALAAAFHQLSHLLIGPLGQLRGAGAAGPRGPRAPLADLGGPLQPCSWLRCRWL